MFSRLCVSQSSPKNQRLVKIHDENRPKSQTQDSDIEKSEIQKLRSISKSKSGALGWVVRVCRARGRGAGGGEKTLKIKRFSKFWYRESENLGICAFLSILRFGCVGWASGYSVAKLCRLISVKVSVQFTTAMNSPLTSFKQNLSVFFSVRFEPVAIVFHENRSKPAKSPKKLQTGAPQLRLVAHIVELGFGLYPGDTMASQPS